MSFEKPKSVNFAPKRSHRRERRLHHFSTECKISRIIIKFCQPKHQLLFSKTEAPILNCADYAKFLRDKENNFHKDFQAFLDGHFLVVKRKNGN
jgi:hypothetical protein